MAAKALWHEAEIMDDRELLKWFLPHLTVWRETLQHCRFMSRALEDSVAWCHGTWLREFVEIVFQSFENEIETTFHSLVQLLMRDSQGCQSASQGHATPYLNVRTSLQDLEGLSDQELETLQRTAAIFASEVDCCFNDLNIGSSGAKVVAEALKTSGTLELHLDNNDVGDEGAEALGASLKSNGSLQQLFLKANSIGNSGAQAFAAGLGSLLD
eukprot:s3762_g2.t1